MSKAALTAQRVPHRRLHRIKTYDAGRICAFVSDEGKKCSTILSISNNAKLCYTHRPRKLPRTRGVAVNSPNHIPLSTDMATSQKE